MYDSIRTIDMYLYRILCDSLLLIRNAHIAQSYIEETFRRFGSNNDKLILDLSKQGRFALSAGLVAFRRESLEQSMVLKLFVINISVVIKTKTTI